MAFGAPVRLKGFAVEATGQGTLALGTIITTASVGDLVVVMFGYGLGSSPTVTVADNSGGGNTYTQAVRADKTTGNVPHSAIFYSVLVGALTTSHTITVTFGTAVNFPCGLAYKTTPTAATTVTLDQTNSGTGVSTTPSSGSVTTTGADEFLAGANCTGAVQTLTAGSGWTLFDNNAGNSTKQIDGEYRIEAGTGTFTADGTHTSADWAMSLTSFKATAAAGGPPVIATRSLN